MGQSIELRKLKEFIEKLVAENVNKGISLSDMNINVETEGPHMLHLEFQLPSSMIGSEEDMKMVEEFNKIVGQ